MLVLDGADALTEDSIAAVGTLVGHIPSGSMIVLAGRVVPDLPVAALRAGGPLLELGPFELGLSRREAELLLRGAGLELEDAVINQLVERTEGWPAGLYLTALSALAGGDEQQDVLAVTGADRYLADYFRSEYLTRLAPERRTFLRRTSVLETMTGPLCDAVLERKGSGLELASLEQANLFVVPLDRHRGAYRYHHLFRELLQQELQEHEPELVPVLNQRAADWFEAKGDPESTLGYSHAAGNEESAARILGSIAMPLSAAGRVTAVESWLARFDTETLDRYPKVAVEGSRIHALRGRPDEAEAWLAAAERGGVADRSTKACIDVLRAAMCVEGPKRMLARSKSALAELAPEHPWHPWALVVNGGAYLLLGDEEAADRVFAEAATTSAQPESQALALSERALLAARHDDDLAETLALEARRLIEDGQLDNYATSALDLAAGARALLRHGQWDEARRQLTITQRLAPSLTYAIPWLSVQVRLELGEAHVTLRDRNGARALLEEAKEILALRPALGVLADQVAELEHQVDAMPRPREPRRVGADAGRAAAAAAALDPPLVPGDRRAPVRLAQHDQDAGDLRLPQARRLEPQRRDRSGGRARAGRSGRRRGLRATRRRVSGFGLGLGPQPRVFLRVAAVVDPAPQQHQGREEDDRADRAPAVPGGAHQEEEQHGCDPTDEHDADQFRPESCSESFVHRQLLCRLGRAERRSGLEARHRPNRMMSLTPTRPGRRPRRRPRGPQPGAPAPGHG